MKLSKHPVLRFPLRVERLVAARAGQGEHSGREEQVEPGMFGGRDAARTALAARVMPVSTDVCFADLAHQSHVMPHRVVA